MAVRVVVGICRIVKATIRYSNHPSRVMSVWERLRFTSDSFSGTVVSPRFSIIPRSLNTRNRPFAR